MEAIIHNPYRVLGLLAGSTAREQDRQIRRIKQFISAEQEAPSDDFSFPVLGCLQQRTLTLVEDAASNINIDKDRINAALFWFYMGNDITDEPAFEHLKNKNIKEATLIWSKLANYPEINIRNASAFSNLSTLLLSFVGYQKEHDKKVILLKKALMFKLLFIESGFVSKMNAVDTTYKVNNKEIELIFLSIIQTELNKYKISQMHWFEIINSLKFIAKDDFYKELMRTIIEPIKSKISEAKAKRKNNPKDAAAIGEALYNQTINELNTARSIDLNNFQYITIADKLTNEILQCGIDYFNHYKDSEKDPSVIAMSLCEKAIDLAVSNSTKQRCKESIASIQQWIDGAPEREKQKKIKSQLDILEGIFQEFNNKNKTIDNAKLIVSKSKLSLENIKITLGKNDDYYLKISTNIAAMAQQFVIEEVNKLQANLEMQMILDKFGTFERVKRVFTNAWDVIILIGNMDMESSFRNNHYNPNKDTLKNICNQLYIKTSSSSSISRKPQNQPYSPTKRPLYTPYPTDSGCYIATMAFGNYDHPQVMILRQFRDEVLSRTVWGCRFIKGYYSVSPKLVKLLKNQKGINSFIRLVLNQFIKAIKMKYLFIFVSLFLSVTNIVAQSNPTEVDILSSLNEQLQTLEVQNAKQNRELKELRSALDATNAYVDSLRRYSQDNAEALNRKGAELGEQIKTTANESKSIIAEVNSLSQKYLYAIIGAVIAVFLSGLVYLLLSKRQKAEKTDLVSQLSQSKSIIEEKLVNEFSKQTDLMESLQKWMEKQKKQQPNIEPNHSLPLKLADEITLMERNISYMDEHTKGLKQLVRSIDKLKDNLVANDYEIPTLLGKPFHEGMKAIVTNSVQDETLPEGIEIITKIIKPQVNFNDRMIQAAQIEVSVN